MDKMIKLRVKFDLGLDDDGKKKSRTLTLSDVSDTATKENLLAVCTHIDKIVDGKREEVVRVTEDVLK